MRPSFLISAGQDLLAPDASRLHQSLLEAGSKSEHHHESHLWHDYPLQAGVLAAADHTTDQLGSFLNRHW